MKLLIMPTRFAHDRKEITMACTTILAGKNATYDGSTFMARDDDSGSDGFNPKKYIMVMPEDQPRQIGRAHV